MTTYKLQLAPPAFLDIASADGTATARIDVIEANRMMVLAQEKPESEMAAFINQWLAGKLNCPIDRLAESTAFELFETVVGIAAQLRAERKKKALAIASSSASTAPDSPATSC